MEPEIVEVTRDSVRCQVPTCGHVWVPNDIEKPPKTCPECNNPNWIKRRDVQE